jgi:hypothetical protein
MLGNLGKFFLDEISEHKKIESAKKASELPKKVSSSVLFGGKKM